MMLTARRVKHDPTGQGGERHVLHRHLERTRARLGATHGYTYGGRRRRYLGRRQRHTGPGRWPRHTRLGRRPRRHLLRHR